jgi:hypothetical protein
MELEVVPSFVSGWELILEAKIKVKYLSVVENGSGHVDEMFIGLMCAEGCGHVFEVAEGDEHVGEWLGRVINLVLCCCSGCGDGSGCDVAIGGEEVIEEIGNVDFEKACSRVDERSEDILTESFENLIEEGAFNVVGFMELFQFCIVDAVSFCNLRSCCFVSVDNWRGLLEAGVTDV